MILVKIIVSREVKKLYIIISNGDGDDDNQ